MVLIVTTENSRISSYICLQNDGIMSSYICLQNNEGKCTVISVYRTTKVNVFRVCVTGVRTPATLPQEPA